MKTRTLSALMFVSILLSSGLFPRIGQARADSPSSPDASVPLYLPLVSRYYLPQNAFGIESDGSGGLDDARRAGSTWYRKNALLWSTVEPVPGAREWNAVSGVESALIQSSRSGLETILIIRGAPAWAQKYSGWLCSAIRNDSSVQGFAAFAQFMYDVVRRYSAPPYNIQYYEIWNEPDVDPYTSNIPPDSPFGCWGDANDPYYGGIYYGQMLAQVYPKVKAAHPGAQVLFGGLLLDCDPNLRGACNQPNAPRFFEGAILGGGNSFDGVSFHAYDYFLGTLGVYGNRNWGSAWDTTGPVLSAKLNFLRSVLNTYGMGDKYLLNTEAAVITAEGYGCSDACQETKAYYAGQVYTVAAAERLLANIWYSNQWRNTALFNSAGAVYPAYNAFSFARTRLSGLSFSQLIPGHSDVRIYEFTHAGNRLWVLWHVGSGAVQVNLPEMPSVVWNWDSGRDNYVTIPVSQSIAVAQAPVYIEWIPK